MKFISFLASIMVLAGSIYLCANENGNWGWFLVVGTIMYLAAVGKNKSPKSNETASASGYAKWAESQADAFLDRNKPR